ncbi:hypothetical protein [Roseivivax sp. THAF30]|uniref:hypothetical protein n=1 Tax=Roseivivax sp. THAF30 TaxID=2587852 RepID=UPI0012682F05|nr:hypothetical protein [Roseivivax sp. THAF30]QFT63151.1 hypothetical protein FIU91_09460 [Roseivivax sp. THAF30]
MSDIPRPLPVTDGIVLDDQEALAPGFSPADAARLVQEFDTDIAPPYRVATAPASELEEGTPPAFVDMAEVDRDFDAY